MRDSPRPSGRDLVWRSCWFLPAPAGPRRVTSRSTPCWAPRSGGRAHVGDDGLEVLAAEVVEELTAAGRHVARIPFGGTSVIGARGYVAAGLELIEQMPDLDVAVVAVGSGGTAAGLVHALGADRVLGVRHRGGAEPRRTDQRSRQRSRRHTAGPAAEDGSGRARLLDADRRCSGRAPLAARTEGLILDPVYTGRALAGLAAAVRGGDVVPGTRVVFLHTGGLPGLFGSGDALRWTESLLGRTYLSTGRGGLVAWMNQEPQPTNVDQHGYSILSLRRTW